MSYNLPKVLQRVQEVAERTMSQDTTATQVLHGCINQYALPLINFKRTGRPPAMEGLEDLAGKLVAIVAATYDMNDARRGRLP